MTKIINKKSSWLLAVSVVVIGAVLLIIEYEPKVELANVTLHSQTAIVSPNGLNKPLSGKRLILTNKEIFIREMVQQMKQKHGHEINKPMVQLAMGDFRDFVYEQFPETGSEIFLRIMTLAFPEHFSEIIALIEKMDSYNLWYGENLLDLNDMNELARRGAIWNKRRTLFGDLADQIWQAEMNAEEAKKQVVHETLDALRKAESMGMNERLYVLQNTIHEQYGDQHDGFLINKGMVANIYFNLESVQKDLHSMTPDERAAAIADSRRQLGFSEADIKYMGEQDAKRESRWQNGFEYMTERDQITSQYQGDELTEKLTSLREKYFSKEAPTIEKEEASGFYRYERPRLYGSN